MSGRLLLSYLSLTLFVLVVLELPLGLSYARNERNDLQAKVERDAVALGTLAADALKDPASSLRERLATVAAQYRRETGGRVVIVDAIGRSIVDTNPAEQGSRAFSSRPEIAEALEGTVATGIRHSDTLDANLLYVVVPVASDGVVSGAVRVTYPTSAIDARVHRYWFVLVAIAAVVLAVASVVALRFARASVRPLAELERAAESAGKGDLSARAPVEGPPEIRSLAQRFNDMIGRLDELVQAHAEFVADASHELRSPLAALQLRLENLEPDVVPDGRDDLEAATGEVARLSSLVEALLALARADAVASAPVPTDVAAVVGERGELWSALCDERSVTLEAEVEPGALARATPGRIEAVLDNLLANALEVSPAGGVIFLRALRVGGRMEIRLADEGPGMSSKDRARAFDRFWRGRRDGEGSGLGLAIVRRLVEADGGSVELLDGRIAGTEAVVRLPLVPARSIMSPSVRFASRGRAAAAGRRSA